MFAFSSNGNVAVSVVGFNVLVSGNGTAKLALNGRGGDDTITAGHGFTFPLEIDGGEGNDLIVGGDGPDVLIGGPGNDTIDGGAGNDIAFLGDGDDTFIWNPGGGSDVVEGEGGTDTLVFNGSNAGEFIELDPNGDRLLLSRNIGSVVMDVAGVEHVVLEARAGADEVLVTDLTGTSVASVDVDLAGIPGTTTGDGAADTVIVLGTPAADRIAITADGGAAVVSGLPATVRVENPEPTDALIVNGLGGVDTFTADPGLNGLILLTISQD